MLIVQRFCALLSIVFFFSCAAHVQNAKPSSYETAIDNSGESDTVIQGARHARTWERFAEQGRAHQIGRAVFRLASCFWNDYRSA